MEKDISKTKIEPTWYVLYVKSKREKKICELLNENGLNSYSPMTKETRQWSDRKKVINVPLFPSYVFVNLKSQKELNKALTINGACAYLKFGSEYAKISDQEMKRINLLTNPTYFQNPKLENRSFSKGQKVKIQEGPLKGIDCDILDNEKRNRVLVRIPSMNQNITVDIAKEYLTPALSAQNTRCLVD